MSTSSYSLAVKRKNIAQKLRVMILKLTCSQTRTLSKADVCHFRLIQIYCFLVWLRRRVDSSRYSATINILKKKQVIPECPLLVVFICKITGMMNVNVSWQLFRFLINVLGKFRWMWGSLHLYRVRRYLVPLYWVFYSECLTGSLES